MLLLLSNSTDPKGRYLEHPREALAAHLAGVRRVLFVPFAGVGVPWDDYAARVGEAFAPLGVMVDGIHRAADMRAAVDAAEAIAVGGGNTFHLLARLQEAGLVDAIRARALAGVPYVGWSAGSVVACPTIRTTNDMPIVEPPGGLGALGLVPFQINAHFTDAHPPGFRGETRRQRLAEYVAANPGMPVVGLPEGDWLEVDGPAATLRGPHAAVLFRDRGPATTIDPRVRIDRLLAAGRADR
ncbi:MAG: dipeptidase PepE [Gemmatirosa sp.]|nr:dipeptidase PepE [Gemmatirosa sp.]